MVAEVLEVLAPKPGEVGVDCTLGYGGHAGELLRRLLPGGRLIGLDVDPVELPKTLGRLRNLGFGPEKFGAPHQFRRVASTLADAGLTGADLILADLGVSSMQLDDPGRGFTVKFEGPLDMRMNPDRGLPALAWLEKTRSDVLAAVLEENADEPQSRVLAQALARRRLPPRPRWRRAFAPLCRDFGVTIWT